MAVKVIMPKLGLTMTEGTIVGWRKKEGDEVKAGEVLFDVATDKLTNEIEAETDGVLRKVFVAADETVPTLTTIGIIGGADEDISALMP